MVFKEIKNYAAILKCAQQMCCKKSFWMRHTPGTDLSHAITPPCKLLCQSTHKSLIYSICCKFFFLVPICCKTLQQLLFLIFYISQHVFKGHYDTTSRIHELWTFLQIFKENFSAKMLQFSFLHFCIFKAIFGFVA